MAKLGKMQKIASGCVRKFILNDVENQSQENTVKILCKIRDVAPHF